MLVTDDVEPGVAVLVQGPLVGGGADLDLNLLATVPDVAEGGDAVDEDVEEDLLSGAPDAGVVEALGSLVGLSEALVVDPAIKSKLP